MCSLYLGENLISGSKPINLGVRNIGEVVASAIPLTDAGLHLLDGSLILGGGIYQGFVDYIADLYYSSSGSSEIRTNPVMTSNTTPYGTASYTGTLYSTSQPFAMFAGSTSSTAWTTSNGSVTYAFDVAQQPLAGTYRFYFQYGSYDASGRSLNNVVITVTYEDNTTSTINVGNLTGTIHAMDSYYVTSEFTTSKKIKSFTLSHSGSSISITTMNIGNFQLQRMVPNYFCQEWQWQQSVTQYGSCGKFVYDSTLNTVRLPKVTGKIDGTTDVNALGDLAPLMVKLPNITAYMRTDALDPSNIGGSFYVSQNESSGAESQKSSYWRQGTFNFSASRSSSVYSGNGSDTTIHEQAIKMFFYIVIANSTKTDIQVDIDEVVTDLNGKADVDLSNISASQSAKNEIVSWGMPDYNGQIQLSTGTTEQTYTAPSKGYIGYNFLMEDNNTGYVKVNDVTVITNRPAGRGLHDFVSGIIPVNKNDVIKYWSNVSGYVYNNFQFYPMKGAN